jgi:hypothetical protein
MLIRAIHRQIDAVPCAQQPFHVRTTHVQHTLNVTSLRSCPVHRPALLQALVSTHPVVRRAQRCYCISRFLLASGRK